MQRSCDWYQYKERHVIECMFGKLKYFRRIATRYEKKASHFMEMLALHFSIFSMSASTELFALSSFYACQGA